MTDDDVKSMAREAGFGVGSLELPGDVMIPYIGAIGDNCFVEVKNLIELAREEPNMALRDIASYMSVGGYNMDEPLDVVKIRDRILNEIERISNVE